MNIVLNVKPFSFNQMYCRDLRHKTSAYQQWLSQVFSQLSSDSNQKQLDLIRDNFDYENNGISVKLEFKYPKQTLYRVKGGISGRAHDLSNVEKPLLDLLFLEKYSKQQVPYGCNNLKIDDKYILELTSRKVAAEGDRHSINVQIEILEI